VQWFDLQTNNQLDIMSFAGGTSQTITVDVVDPSGVAYIGTDSEVDAASIAVPAPEPGSLALLGSGLIAIGEALRKRLRSRR